MRPLQTDATTYVLTPQRSISGEWEVIQQVSPTSGMMLVFAYGAAGSEPIRVALHRVRPDTIYEIRSADHGVLGHQSGARLIADGLEITWAPETSAQVLVLEPQTQEPFLRPLGRSPR